MSSETEQMEKQMVIRELVPGITTLSVPFSRGGVVKFGGRATIVTLPTGLAVFNPVHLTPSVQTLIQKSSLPIQYIVAPDVEHHIHLSTWATAFPSALVLGPEGLPEKRASQNGSNKSVTILDFYKVFTRKEKDVLEKEGRKWSVDENFDKEFDIEYVDAHLNKELVFLHKKSKTLIEADMLFNLPAHEQYSKTGQSATSGIFSGLFAKMNSTEGNAIWQRRFAWYLISAKDRDGWNKSVQRIEKWDFENIVPAHGDSILGNGKEIWRRVMEWHL